jgi:hypothetical protein
LGNLGSKPVLESLRESEDLNYTKPKDWLHHLHLLLVHILLLLAYLLGLLAELKECARSLGTQKQHQEYSRQLEEPECTNLFLFQIWPSIQPLMILVLGLKLLVKLVLAVVMAIIAVDLALTQVLATRLTLVLVEQVMFLPF